jgi:nicotinamide-nucleotide amidase
VRVEVLAVGTELLLGQIVDTNSAWLGEQLALAGIDSHFHQVVGDNQARIVLTLRSALARSDGVVVCGGLGPTHDDITRDAIAEVMAVPLVRDDDIVKRIAEMFSSRGRAISWAPRPGSSAPSATRWSTRCPASPTSWSRCSPGPCSPTCGAGPTWPARRR